MKKALALLLAVCLVTFSVGCSGEDTESTTEGTTTSTTSE